MLLVECNVLEKVKVINEGTKGGPSRLRLQGKFQQCDEQNNNGRIYPKSILENQVNAIQEKIGDRSLVGALDHPANDAIHLSQASHVITKLWLEKDGSVMGECEILSTPNGKIVEALINDGVKIGISSRGVGSVTEGIKGKIVNEDFKLITFDLVSDPSTRGAFPELTESIRENSQRAQEIVSKHKKDRVLLTMLESKISEALKGKQKKLDKNNNGELDSQDFMILRKIKKPQREGLGGSDEVYTPEEKADERRRRKKQRAGKLPKPKPQESKLGEGKNKGTDSNIDDLPDNYEYEVPPKMKTKKKPREDSSTNIRAAIIEGFKRACWGDRYDEMDLGSAAVKARMEKRAADKKARDAAAGSGPTEDQRMAAQEEKARQLRIQQASQKQHASTTIDRFADVIRERCWKGYKPVKGKKPYSKGSCTKEGYEQFGKAIFEMIKTRKEGGEATPPKPKKDGGSYKPVPGTRTVGGELGSQGKGKMSPKAVRKAVSYTPEEIKANDAYNARTRKLRGRQRSDI